MLALAAERWQMEFDLADRSRDARLSAGIEEAVKATEAWTAREPSRAEAWFYLGAAYGMRAQLRIMRRELLAAARDGRRIRSAFERALALDPGIADARFGLGLYRYLAGVVPAPIRLLAWLLMLPGGDRVRGWQEMMEARGRGMLLAAEADFQLHWFYLWYENQPEKSLALLRDLHARFPHNPVFSWRIAEVHDVSFHDRPASRDQYRALLDAAEGGRVAASEIARVRARLGLAEQLDALYESDRALDVLTVVVDSRPAAPSGALARAQYLVGLVQDRMGRRAPAVAAYRAALAAVPADDPAGLGTLVRARLDRVPDARLGQAYRLSLEGWRALERSALADAAAALAHSIELNPSDPVTRYRLGRLHLARGEPARARAEFDRTIMARPPAPPAFLAAAYLEAAHVAEGEGHRARAIEMYRAASGILGAEPQSREAARAALARLLRADPDETPPVRGAASR